MEELTRNIEWSRPGGEAITQHGLFLRIVKVLGAQIGDPVDDLGRKLTGGSPAGALSPFREPGPTGSG